MMWFEKRGIVAKISDKTCIVVTPDGTYKKIPLPAQGTQVGAEVAYYNSLFSSAYKPQLMVASILFLLISYTLLQQAILPQAVAYVSLDINPSLEMSVDKHMRVIDVQCFNDDAANLVKQLPLQGKGLNDALTAVVDKAIEQNYIKPGQDNLMVSTISSPGTDPTPVDQEAVCQVLEQSIYSSGLDGQVIVYSASGDFRTAAESQKLSPGKYLIYEQLVKSGNQVSVDDVHKQTIHQLIDTYKMDLLPNYKKITFHKPKTNGEPEIEVDDNGQNVPIEEYVKKHSSHSLNDSGKTNNNQTDNNNNHSSSNTKKSEGQQSAGQNRESNNGNQSDQSHGTHNTSRNSSSKSHEKNNGH
ncbi:MAG TPA: anti-sigma factor domain-containing protein [Syntrophomonadaceae bacterium]|nr:anti-sigma factor domain-containing protein [Syntrophomonadaceae bacterium]